MMLVVKPKPLVRFAAISALVGLYRFTMTSWQDGLGVCSVIQNQRAVLKAKTELLATLSGLRKPSKPNARPA